MAVDPEPLDRPSAAARVRYRMLAVAVAVAAPTLVWIVASSAGITFDVSTPVIESLRIGIPLVVVSTVPLAFAAWGLLAVLERRTPRATTIWTATAVVVLVLSVPPLAVLDTANGTTLTLGFMHLAAGVPLILMLPHPARRVAPESHRLLTPPGARRNSR